MCCIGVHRSAFAGTEGPSHTFELEEQVEQQQKIIRYLQAQLELCKVAGAVGGSPPPLLPAQQNGTPHTQQESMVMQQQMEALQLGSGGHQRPGSGGMSAALQQQVLTLQVGLHRLQIWQSARASTAWSGELGNACCRLVSPWLLHQVA